MGINWFFFHFVYTRWGNAGGRRSSNSSFSFCLSFLSHIGSWLAAASPCWVTDRRGLIERADWKKINNPLACTHSPINTWKNTAAKNIIWIQSVAFLHRSSLSDIPLFSLPSIYFFSFPDKQVEIKTAWIAACMLGLRPLTFIPHTCPFAMEYGGGDMLECLHRASIFSFRAYDVSLPIPPQKKKKKSSAHIMLFSRENPVCLPDFFSRFLIFAKMVCVCAHSHFPNSVFRIT